MTIFGLLTTIGLILGLGGATLVSRLPVASPRSARNCLAWGTLAVGVAVQALGTTLGLSSRMSMFRAGAPADVQPVSASPGFAASPAPSVGRVIVQPVPPASAPLTGRRLIPAGGPLLPALRETGPGPGQHAHPGVSAVPVEAQAP